MIEWRWDLSPLSVRDATATNLATALDFDKKPKESPPQYSVPAVVPVACAPSPAAPAAVVAPRAVPDDEWPGLADLARAAGFA